MNILIINYEMDEYSAVLSWQSEVANALVRQGSSVTVITRQIGRLTAFPRDSVILAKQQRVTGINRFDLAICVERCIRQALRERQINVCFVHMASDLVPYAYLSLRLRGIPIVMWYAHGTVTPSLRRTLRLVNRVVTSSTEGFRIDSPKVRVIGQGINAELFSPAPSSAGDGFPSIVYVGRISRRKQVHAIIAAFKTLVQRHPEEGFRLHLVGPCLGVDDLAYERELHTAVWEAGLQDHVCFFGFVPRKFIPGLHRQSFLHINLSNTGSMDKTVLESLSMGIPVLTSNEAYVGKFPDYPEFLVSEASADCIADQIYAMYRKRNQVDATALRGLVLGNHDLECYAQRLLEVFREVAR